MVARAAQHHFPNSSSLQHSLSEQTDFFSVSTRRNTPLPDDRRGDLKIASSKKLQTAE